MEFLAGSEGPIIPDLDTPAPDEQMVRTETAMDLFRNNAAYIKYFKQRAAELGRCGRDTVVTLISVDDPTGGVLADALMPGHDWQRYRDAGEPPIAGGLANKERIPEFLRELGYEEAARGLTETDDLRVLVLDAGVALVLDVDFSAPEGAIDPQT